MSILIVGEKPSVSRAISAVVGASSAHKGYTKGNGYIVSWCVGHLVGLKYPNDYGNGWDQKWSFSQLPMIPDSWLFHVTDSTKAQYDLLKNLMNKDVLIVLSEYLSRSFKRTPEDCCKAFS